MHVVVVVLLLPVVLVLLHLESVERWSAVVTMAAPGWQVHPEPSRRWLVLVPAFRSWSSNVVDRSFW
jgi:hypothetical protein